MKENIRKFIEKNLKWIILFICLIGFLALAEDVLVNSFKYAFEGVVSAFKTERNMKIHTAIMFLVIIAGILFKINRYEWIMCIICFAIVIGGELCNTAIEIVVDMVMPYKNEKAKAAKDIAASAVLVLAICAAVIGLIIFVPKIM